MNSSVIDMFGIIQPHKWAFIPYLPSFLYFLCFLLFDNKQVGFFIFIPTLYPNSGIFALSPLSCRPSGVTTILCFFLSGYASLKQKNQAAYETTCAKSPLNQSYQPVTPLKPLPSISLLNLSCAMIFFVAACCVWHYLFDANSAVWLFV